MIELKWGETPWDDMTREDLLREVQRMFSVLQSANSVLRLPRSRMSEAPSGAGREAEAGR